VGGILHFTNDDKGIGFFNHAKQSQENSVEIKVGAKMEKEIRPKVDHNINLAGLLVIDADTVLGKLKREEKGILKVYTPFPKNWEMEPFTFAMAQNSLTLRLLIYFSTYFTLLKSTAGPKE
jgi:hypothetical protein